MKIQVLVIQIKIKLVLDNKSFNQMMMVQFINILKIKNQY